MNYILFHVITVVRQSKVHMFLDNANTVIVVNLEHKQQPYTDIQISINEILT
jgi:hypothetical protein